MNKDEEIEFRKLLLRVAMEKHTEECPVRWDITADCTCGEDERSDAIN